MKALEKIVEAKENMNIGYIEWANDCIDEAIAELKEAMKPKSCDGCIREEEDMQDPHCVFCSRACKDNYEAKDNA